MIALLFLIHLAMAAFDNCVQYETNDPEFITKYGSDFVELLNKEYKMSSSFKPIGSSLNLNDFGVFKEKGKIGSVRVYHIPDELESTIADTYAGIIEKDIKNYSQFKGKSILSRTYHDCFKKIDDISITVFLVLVEPEINEYSLDPLSTDVSREAYSQLNTNEKVHFIYKLSEKIGDVHEEGKVLTQVFPEFLIRLDNDFLDLRFNHMSIMKEANAKVLKSDLKHYNWLAGAFDKELFYKPDMNFIQMTTLFLEMELGAEIRKRLFDKTSYMDFSHETVELLYSLCKPSDEKIDLLCYKKEDDLSFIDILAKAIEYGIEGPKSKRFTIPNLLWKNYYQVETAYAECMVQEQLEAEKLRAREIQNRVREPEPEESNFLGKFFESIFSGCMSRRNRGDHLIRI